LKTNYLHIISFDIPFPADYGGVMDVFYKLKALHEAGLKIVLHCFQYRDRQAQSELEKYCEKVYYYKRNLSLLGMLSSQPFIVKSRTSSALLKNLKSDNYPILFEGLHTCGIIDDKILRGRFKIIRMHNVEWEYYRNLEALENRIANKIYFKTESLKLQKFESYAIKQAQSILTISPDDEEYFKQLCEKQNLNENIVNYIPPFHPNSTVDSKTERGEYVLFHGKLSVPDNEQGAMYLIKKVFSKVDVPFIIAGKDPSVSLIDLARKYDNITIKANPNEETMNDLIQNAQINLLVSFQRSGMKLKLLNALYRGRFCIANRSMIQNTGLESLCIVKNTSKEIAATIESYMNLQFSNKQISERREILEKAFSNKINALKIVDILPQI
jgi:Glycosyl transferases group 1